MKISKKLSAALLAATLCAAAPAKADWLIKSYSTGGGGFQITNYASADAVIGGSGLAAGFPVTDNYTFADTWDNNGNSGSFGPGVQLSGLAPGIDHNDFAFVGTGQLSVGATASYTFRTNTDDGSRLKISVNGGPFNQVITDDVLSGPHDVNSAAIPLTAGDNVAFNWMWFERGGGAEGEFSYNNGGAQVVVGDNSQGLTLVGGSLSGKVYKLDETPQTPISSLAVALSIVTPANLRGSILAPTVNTNNDAGNAGHFPGDIGTPGIPPGGENLVVNSTGLLHVLVEGDYRFGALSDDGSQLKLDGVGVIVDDSFHGAGDPLDIKLSGVVHLLPGYHPIEALWFEAGGGALGEFFLVDNVSGAPIALLGDAANGGLQVTQVPEPSTLMLLGSALAAMCWWRRRN